MKNIAFLLPAMRIGGAEKIFLNFLKTLPKEYKITVILNDLEGDLLKELPTSVTVVQDKLLSFKDVLNKDIKSFKIIKIFKDLLYYLRVKLVRKKEKNYRYVVKRYPNIKEKFDCAIAFVGNVSTQIFSLIDRIKADKKIAWIHGETAELKDTKLFESCYRQCDKIFCVSKTTKEHFVSRFPSCIEITDVYYNPIDKESILHKAKEVNNENMLFKEYFNVCTVGRLSPEKGCSMIAEIAQRVQVECSNFRWYIVGDGSERALIEKEIKNKSLESVVFCVGNKNNPYPYIAQCDVYVQPSFEEGYSTTICEAGILGKPIVGTTTSGGIREQLVDKQTGLIVPPTPNDIANAIIALYNSSKLREELSIKVSEHDFNHENEIGKFINFLKN